jgi:hypothetical protein
VSTPWDHIIDTGFIPSPGDVFERDVWRADRTLPGWPRVSRRAYFS